MRLITLLILIPFLTGCGLFGPKITTEVVTVKVPVVYSPAPPHIIRPDLVLHDMTEAQKNDPGSVAKYYKATVIQLLGYSEELENALSEYLKINEALKENARIVDDQMIVEKPEKN